MKLKVNYGDMTPAVRRALIRRSKEEIPVPKKEGCPGSEVCPFPDLLCSECELDH